MVCFANFLCLSSPCKSLDDSDDGDEGVDCDENDDNDDNDYWVEVVDGSLSFLDWSSPYKNDNDGGDRVKIGSHKNFFGKISSTTSYPQRAGVNRRATLCRFGERVWQD